MVETFARMRSVIATRCSTDSCAWRPGGEETELGAIFTRSFYYSFLWNIPRNDQLLLVANKTLTLGWKKSSNHRETLLTFVSVYMWTKAAFFGDLEAKWHVCAGLAASLCCPCSHWELSCPLCVLTGLHLCSLVVKLSFPPSRGNTEATYCSTADSAFKMETVCVFHRVGQCGSLSRRTAVFLTSQHLMVCVSLIVLQSPGVPTI